MSRCRRLCSGPDTLRRTLDGVGVELDAAVDEEALERGTPAERKRIASAGFDFPVSFGSSFSHSLKSATKIAADFS